MLFWLSKGGVVMVPIILCSFFALAIITERILFYYYNLRRETRTLLAKILEAVRKNRIAEAVDVCEKNPYYITDILKAGLIHAETSKDTVKEAMESASLYEIPRLEKNLSFLNMIANVCPLFGLLGTAIGLCKSFYLIHQKSLNMGVVASADLAGGLAQALIGTVAGLCVAIIAYLAYNYFVQKVQFYTLEAEKAASQLLEALTERRYAGEV
jgi:biopolymer transport protein ExbB